mmetsp:Transcript_11305/g.30438  ORF Transcript_11305/g.30438 Transcript_11305/m.30438 type:complete len:249 (-) Transcript_11305:1257-2003(-)
MHAIRQHPMLIKFLALQILRRLVHRPRGDVYQIAQQIAVAQNFNVARSVLAAAQRRRKVTSSSDRALCRRRSSDGGGRFGRAVEIFADAHLAARGIESVAHALALLPKPARIRHRRQRHGAVTRAELHAIADVRGSILRRGIEEKHSRRVWSAVVNEVLIAVLGGTRVEQPVHAVDLQTFRGRQWREQCRRPTAAVRSRGVRVERIMLAHKPHVTWRDLRQKAEIRLGRVPFVLNQFAHILARKQRLA